MNRCSARTSDRYSGGGSAATGSATTTAEGREQRVESREQRVEVETPWVFQLTRPRRPADHLEALRAEVVA